MREEQPTGENILASETGELKVQSGTGVLLRVVP